MVATQESFMHFHPFSIRFVIPILACALMLAGARGSHVTAQNDSTDAQAIVEEAAATMLDLDSFHFSVTTPVGKTILADQAELTGIKGDVLRPDSFQAQFTIELGFISLDLHAIGIGSNLWVSDPLSEDGQFINISEMGGETLPPQALLNPDQLVMLAVGLLRDPVIKGDDEIDGEPVVNIEGTFDPSDLESLGTPVPEEILAETEPLTVNLWIDEQHRILRAEFAGALLPSERGAGRVVRRVDLSAFNEPVTIEAPEGQA
jgi:LppX/LprAFG-like lipoprotein